MALQYVKNYFTNIFFNSSSALEHQSNTTTIENKINYGHFVPEIQKHYQESFCFSHLLENYKYCQATELYIPTAEEGNIIRLHSERVDAGFLITENSWKKNQEKYGPYYDLFKYIPDSNKTCAYITAICSGEKYSATGLNRYIDVPCEATATKPLVYYREDYISEFFSHLIELLTYSSENLSCQCYWPHRCETSKKISDLAYEILSKEMEKGIAKMPIESRPWRHWTSEHDYPYYKFSWILETLMISSILKIEGRNAVVAFEASKFKFLCRLLTSNFLYSHYKKLFENIKMGQAFTFDKEKIYANYFSAYDDESRYSSYYTNTILNNESLSQEKRFVSGILQTNVKIADLTKIIFPDYLSIEDHLVKIQPLFIELYKNCLVHHPHLTIYKELIDLYIDQKKYIDANNLLHTALDAYPKDQDLINKKHKLANPEIYLEQGLEGFQNGDYESALNHFQQYAAQTSVSSEFKVGENTKNFSNELLHGIGDSFKGLFFFASDLIVHPIHTGTQVCHAFEELAKLVSTNDWEAIGEALVPEALDLVKEWNSLSVNKRLGKAGYIFGKYGADFLIPGTILKGISKGAKAAKELNTIAKVLKTAEHTLVLESAATLENGAQVAKIIQTNQKMVEVAEKLGFNISETIKLKNIWKLESASNIAQLEQEISNWLGKGTRFIRNEAGDSVFLSQDGLKRVRFDLNNPSPHINPHSHVEIKIGAKWIKSGPIYPVDVPHN